VYQPASLVVPDREKSLREKEISTVKTVCHIQQKMILFIYAIQYFVSICKIIIRHCASAPLREKKARKGAEAQF